MAGNDTTYTVDQLSTSGTTVTVTDSDGGIDTLDFDGTYTEPTDIRLNWSGNTPSTDAMGFYFFPGNTGHRLVVNGMIENVLGSNGRDFITGNEVANLLYGDQASTGLGGNDTISGEEGNDTVYGGVGSDSLSGAEDNDLMYGDAGVDTISGGSGIDTVEGGTGADSLSGGADVGDTVSYEFSGARVVIALQFGTTVLGAGGDAEGDLINGFTDIYGSDFSDALSEKNSSSLKLDNAFFGFGGNDRLALNGGNDRGLGGDGNDTVLGQAGKDTLIGDAGNDQLTGGADADRLTGGVGADRFIFTAKGDSTVAVGGRDTIGDFARAEGDKINLAGIDAKSGAGNQAFTFIGTAGFDGDKGDLRYVRSGTNVIVMGDIDGDRKADFAIVVQHMASLQGGDFIL